MKTIGLFIGLFLMCACSSVRVAYDYDTAVNFSTYRSYNFYPSIESGLNSLDNHRIMTITDSILRFRGWEKSDTPQLYINFYASENIALEIICLSVSIAYFPTECNKRSKP